jgi:hypothetical protein
MTEDVESMVTRSFEAGWRFVQHTRAMGTLRSVKSTGDKSCNVYVI